MLRLRLFLTLLAPTALMFAGCFDSSSDSDDEGRATYVAMGDAFTSGFQNNGLRADWQKQSYPALIAQQIGVEDFQLPIVDSPGIGRTRLPDGSATIPLFQQGGTITTKPLGKPPTELLSNRLLPRPYQNLGVPGAATIDVLLAYDSTTSFIKGNGFFNMILRGPILNNTTMLHQAINQKPEILSLWIGSSDILGAVVEGTITAATMTPLVTYEGLMNKILDSLLTQTSARIFMANIPTMTTLPYVTTVPRFVFNPTTFQADTTTPLLTKEADVRYVLLPALQLLLTGSGIPTAKRGKGDSLPANLTLTATEVTTVTNLVDAYNAYLSSKAAANPDRITLVDVDDLFKKLRAGQITGLTSNFALLDPTRTAFGLDGIHPNSAGYKEVANLFIETMNGTLSKSYPKVP